MDENALNQICQQVYRQFPELKGVRPKVKAHTGGQKLVIFDGKATTASGKAISRTVRVVVGENGKVIKISTSR